MSRSGYSDDCENVGLWRSAVRQAIKGRRGQAFLREMLADLDALPSKLLIADDFVDAEGGVCAIGSVAVARGVDASKIDIDDAYTVAQAFGIARALAAEIAYINDEAGRYGESPEARYKRVRRWVEEQIIER